LASLIGILVFDGHNSYCLVFSSEITLVTPNPAIESQLPRPVFAADPACLYAFPPNRETLGGTAYLLLTPAGNILIDSPAWTIANQDFLREQGVRWLFISHRSNMGKKVLAMQQTLGCAVVVQEQEAYLLPGVKITTFPQEFQFGNGIQAFWTPGHTPGSACLYCPAAATIASGPSGGILFTGRHLLPDRQGRPVPLRTAKTFHWPRQIRQVQAVLDRFTPQTLHYICPGASLGFLRGSYTIAAAYQQLSQLELSTLLRTVAIL
jgi:hypothetical protein